MIAISDDDEIGEVILTRVDPSLIFDPISPEPWLPGTSRQAGNIFPEVLTGNRTGILNWLIEPEEPAAKRFRISPERYPGDVWDSNIDLAEYFQFPSSSRPFLDPFEHPLTSAYTGPDRISTLPDVVLRRIFGFLKNDDLFLMQQVR